MRIWDIHPGYLNRQSLLGEHRELHGIVSIVVNGKKVSVMKPHHDFSDLAALLTEKLRTPPVAGGLKNTLQHMWGHLSHHHADKKMSHHGRWADCSLQHSSWR